MEAGNYKEQNRVTFNEPVCTEGIMDDIVSCKVSLYVWRGITQNKIVSRSLSLYVWRGITDNKILSRSVNLCVWRGIKITKSVTYIRERVRIE